MADIQNVLADAKFMIREELAYIATGKHPGVPMRDCAGQWRALLREIQEVFAALEDA